MGDLENLGSLIKKRNAVAHDITTMIGRPAQIGHRQRKRGHSAFSVRNGPEK
jgi:hypothetical protein